MCELSPVSFHEDTIFCIEYEGQPYTAMKPIVENMGLAWQSQAAKLTGNKDRWGITMIVIPSEGGEQETLCMPVRKLPAYLASINPKKVREELRPKIELYQAESDDVLWDYWINGKAEREQSTLLQNPTSANSPLTPDQQCTLRAIMRSRVEQAAVPNSKGSCMSLFQQAWSRFNNHFRIARYSQLPQAKMSEAIAYLMKLEFGKKAAVEMPDAVDMVEAIPDFDMSKLPRGFEQMLEKADEAQALLKNIEHLMNFTTPCCYNSAIGEEKMLFVRNAKDCIQIARTNLKSCEYALRSFARIRSRIKFLYDGPARTV